MLEEASQHPLHSADKDVIIHHFVSRQLVVVVPHK